MKQVIMFLFGFVGAAAFAATNKVVVSFSTPGPDKYADGTIVLDDECYALCWSPDEFAGIAANGQPVNPNDKIVCTVPAAKGGKCPSANFQIDAAFAEANYANGNYSLWLLDTRRGDGTLFGVKDNAAIAVRAASQINSTINSTINSAIDSMIDSTAEGHPVAVELQAGVQMDADAFAPMPDDETTLPEPVIKSITIFGDMVMITVANTVPYRQYGVNAAEALDAEPLKASTLVLKTLASADGEAARYPDVDGEVTIVRPIKAGGEFFKAVHK